jgi:hypothetical protein
MRPTTLTTLHRIDEAIVKLMTARLDLREAGCLAAVRKLTSAINSAEDARRHAERCHKNKTVDRTGSRCGPNITATERRLVCDLLRSAIASQEGLDGASDDPAGAILARSTLGKMQAQLHSTAEVL